MAFAPPGRARQDAFNALLLTIAWAAVVVLVTQDVVSHYFPLADEWALIANSHPDFATPWRWLTEGFSQYFLPPPGLPHESGANLIRPVFNLTYWLCGLWLAPESGGYLYITYLAIAACSGLAYLSIVQSGLSRRSALVLAASAPMMPSLIPALEPLIYPCMGFDVVAAAFTMLAFLAYRSRRWALVALWMGLAVFTKETALPIAAALPALFLIEHRKRILGERRLMAGFALMATPLLAWLIVRLLAFGAADSADVYVLQGNAHGLLYRQARILTKWPFWTETSPLFQDPDLTRDTLATALLLLANGMLMTGVLSLILIRVLNRQMPRVEEVCLFSCYFFLLIVGVSPRYGVLLDLFLLICLAVWWADHPRHPWPRWLVAMGLGTGLVVSTFQTVVRFPELRSNFLRYSEVGHRYVSALRTFGPDETVVVLNDPVTFWMPVKWLNQTMRIQATVVKLADYAWSPHLLDGIEAPCDVALEFVPERRSQYRFTQSCGIDLLSATRYLQADRPFHFDFGDGTSIELAPYAEAPSGERTRWESMLISPGRPDTRLLYFDPRSSDFKTTPSRKLPAN